MLRTAARRLVIVSALLSLSVMAAQQSPEEAPIPAQITSAKKVFIANAPGESLPSEWGPNRIYDQFYAAMKSWGRYELVAAPADADLVFEISFVAPLGMGDILHPETRVVILDPKTHVPLWWLHESVGGAWRGKNILKNFDEATGKLVDDLKQLAGPPAAEHAKN